MHELQSLLLQKLPRLGELTFGCEVLSNNFGTKYKIIAKCYDGWHVTQGGGLSILNDYLFKNGSVEILGKPASHSDILEALGEDWAMTGDHQLLFFPRGHTSMVFGMDMGPQWIEKGIALPSNISDLSLPEYEETRKELIQLLTK